jgi:hypothetical protein
MPLISSGTVDIQIFLLPNGANIIAFSSLCHTFFSPYKLSGFIPTKSSCLVFSHLTFSIPFFTFMGFGIKSLDKKRLEVKKYNWSGVARVREQ